MGSFLVGHVLSGLAFIAIGLWQLFNHIKLHALRPDSYNAPLWFPTRKIRYLELYLMMSGSAMSVGVELFFLPENNYQPLDSDGTIPSNYLHNFEHSLISATVFTYAVFAILLDKASPRTKIQPQVQTRLAQIIWAVVFGQQLLIFHLHSSDHMGVEGQYHLLLQILVSISLATTLIGIARSQSFLVSFVRSVSVLFQGIWLCVMGVMLWTPSLAPKGCYLNYDEGLVVMRCHSDESLHRAKALVNIEFSWYVILVVTFSVVFFLAVDKEYGKKSEKYQYSLPTTTLNADDDGSKGFIDSEKKSLMSNGDMDN